MKLLHFLRLLWVRWQIQSTEQYLRECADDGLTTSLMLTEWRRQLGELRVREIDIETALRQTIERNRRDQSC